MRRARRLPHHLTIRRWQNWPQRWSHCHTSRLLRQRLLLKKIPAPPATIPQNLEAELSSAESPQTDPVLETPARIPIRPIVRSNAAAAKTEASAAMEAANTDANASVRSVVPPPRPPQAKPRLRPRPNLQPRFESVLDSMAFADDLEPPPPTPLFRRLRRILNQSHIWNTLRPRSRLATKIFNLPKHPRRSGPEVRQRQRNKFFWFVGCEIIVLALLVGAVIFGWSHRFGNGSLSPAARLGAIVAAIAGAVLPMIFYGLPKTLPRDRR